jgi:hypothetical protein
MELCIGAALCAVNKPVAGKVDTQVWPLLPACLAILNVLAMRLF